MFVGAKKDKLGQLVGWVGVDWFFFLNKEAVFFVIVHCVEPLVYLYVGVGFVCAWVVQWWEPCNVVSRVLDQSVVVAVNDRFC